MSDDFEAQRKKRHEALDDKRKRLEEMKRNRLGLKTEEPKVAPIDEKRAEVDSLVDSLLKSNKSMEQEPISPTNLIIKSDESISPSIPQLSKQDSISEKLKRFQVVKIVSFHLDPSPKTTYEKDTQTDFTVEDLSDSEVDYHKHSTRKSPHHHKQSQSYQKPLSFDLNSSKEDNNHHQLSNTELSLVDAKKEFSPEEKAEVIGRPDFAQFFRSAGTIMERALFQASSPYISLPHALSLPLSSSPSSSSSPPQLSVSLPPLALLSSLSSFDLLKDYRLLGGGRNGGADSGPSFSVLLSFFSPQLGLRPVMDINLSDTHPELILVAYGSSSSSSSNRYLLSGGDDLFSSLSSSSISSSLSSSPGGVCVWSLQTPSRPEFTLTSSSPVLSSRFLPPIFSSSSSSSSPSSSSSSAPSVDSLKIIGGCQNGQLVLWDVDSPSLSSSSSSTYSSSSRLLPSQRSSLSGRGHKHPVYSLETLTQPFPLSESTPTPSTSSTSRLFSPSTNSSSTSSSSSSSISSSQDCTLISASTEGTVCQWDPLSLSEPLTSLPLPLPQPLSLPSSQPSSSSSSSYSSLSLPLSSSSSVSCLCLFRSSSSEQEQHKKQEEEDRRRNTGTGSTDTGSTVSVGCWAVLGTGGGAILIKPLPFKRGETTRQVQAHSSLITSLHPHPSSLPSPTTTTNSPFSSSSSSSSSSLTRSSSSSPFCRSLLLSSSLDWTVKIWTCHPDSPLIPSCLSSSSLSSSSNSSSSLSSSSPFLSLLLEIQSPSFDYIIDAKWHPDPSLPSLLGLLTSSGSFFLYDLLVSRTEPRASVHLPDLLSMSSFTSSSISSSSSSSLNSSRPTKFLWTREGRGVWVGEGTGRLSLVSLSDSFFKPHQHAEQRLESVLLRIDKLLLTPSSSSTSPSFSSTSFSSSSPSSSSSSSLETKFIS